MYPPFKHQSVQISEAEQLLPTNWYVNAQDLHWQPCSHMQVATLEEQEQSRKQFFFRPCRHDAIFWPKMVSALQFSLRNSGTHL